MKGLSEYKIFEVGFKKDRGSSIWYNPEFLYVIAKGYDEAANKALQHIIKMDETESINKSVVGWDGSLNLNTELRVNITLVRMLSEKII